jgi:ubiquinone/menaquinone biosynthesis C-methylase UbiE
MKYRESGMPSEDMWVTFFDPMNIVEKLGIDNKVRNLLDIGCGYGTFLFPISKIVSGKVIGLDIDQQMIESCNNKINQQGIKNVKLVLGDISSIEVQKQLSMYLGEIDYACLFNILHCEEPVKLLSHVREVLSGKGRIGVSHWIKENTPRGPSMEIRPTPEEIIKWAEEAGFKLHIQVSLPPYHFGLVFEKL